MERYLREVGLVRDTEKAMTFRQLDEALEWIEARLLGAELDRAENDRSPWSSMAWNICSAGSRAR